MIKRYRQWIVMATVALLAACASAPQKKVKPAVTTVDVQESVGFTITELADIDDAVRLDYDRALILLESGDFEAGIPLMESVVVAAPQLSAPYIDLGIAYHQQGDLEAAEKNLRLGLEANPEHPIAHNELGIVYRKTARFAEARSSYESALAVYPGYHYARRKLAVLCDLYLADFECAMENYEAYMAAVVSDDEATMWMRDLEYRMQQAGQ